MIFDSGVCEKRFPFDSLLFMYTPTLPPSRQCWRDDGAAAPVQKGNLFSQASSPSRLHAINIDEKGEGCERPLTFNAGGNLFSQTPVSKKHVVRPSICVRICVCARVHTCMHACVRVCMCACMRARVCASMCARVRSRVFVCMCVCVFCITVLNLWRDGMQHQSAILKSVESRKANSPLQRARGLAWPH